MHNLHHFRLSAHVPLRRIPAYSPLCARRPMASTPSPAVPHFSPARQPISYRRPRASLPPRPSVKRRGSPVRHSRLFPECLQKRLSPLCRKASQKRFSVPRSSAKPSKAANHRAVSPAKLIARLSLRLIAPLSDSLQKLPSGTAPGLFRKVPHTARPISRPECLSLPIAIAFHTLPCRILRTAVVSLPDTKTLRLLFRKTAGAMILDNMIQYDQNRSCSAYGSVCAHAVNSADHSESL